MKIDNLHIEKDIKIQVIGRMPMMSLINFLDLRMEKALKIWGGFGLKVKPIFLILTL